MVRDRPLKNLINHRLMEFETKAIKQSIKNEFPSIYNFIDIQGIRQYLVYHPKLLLMFEILVNHIDEYINHRMITGKDTLNKSSHI